MTYSAVFQKSLSTNVCIFKTNYTDIHTKKDYKKVLKKYEENIVVQSLYQMLAGHMVRQRQIILN